MQRRLRKGGLVRLVPAMPVVLGLAVGSITPAPAATTGRHIEDGKYKISFYLPANWAKAKITMSTKGPQKLLIVNSTRAAAATVAQVIVTPGRQIAASQLATVLRQSGATVAGAHLANFASINDVEQLSYSLESNNVLVHGIAEGFYLHKVTYYVAVDSSSSALVASTVTKIMNTWGT